VLEVIEPLLFVETVIDPEGYHKPINDREAEQHNCNVEGNVGEYESKGGEIPRANEIIVKAEELDAYGDDVEV
jgi:hypothetical protein